MALHADKDHQGLDIRMGRNYLKEPIGDGVTPCWDAGSNLMLLLREIVGYFCAFMLGGSLPKAS